MSCIRVDATIATGEPVLLSYGKPPGRGWNKEWARMGISRGQATSRCNLSADILGQGFSTFLMLQP